jgi:hypothetical protein
MYNRRSLHYFKKNNPADVINFGKEKLDVRSGSGRFASSF